MYILKNYKFYKYNFFCETDTARVTINKETGKFKGMCYYIYNYQLKPKAPKFSGQICYLCQHKHFIGEINPFYLK